MLEENSVLKTEGEKLKSTNTGLVDENGKLRGQVDKASEENEKLKNDTVSLREEYDKLKKQLEQGSKENGELRSQKADQDQRVLELEKSQSALSEENKQLKSAKDDIARQLKTITEARDTLQTKYGKLEEANNTLQLEYGQRLKEIAILRGQLPTGPTPPPAQPNKLQDWNTEKKGLSSWQQVADFFRISLAELERLNPDIKGKKDFIWGQRLKVPWNINPETGQPR